MAFPGASEVDLILALQDDAARGGSWTGFLTHLAGITGSRFAAMVSRMPGSGQVIDILTAMPSGLPVTKDLDLLPPILTERMRPERIYSASDMADLVEIPGGETFDEALGRLGVTSVNAMRVAVPTVTVVFGLFGARPFDAADGAVLRRLHPYLHLGIRTASRVWHERLHATMTAGLARRNSLGWFLLDRSGAVLDHWLATPAAGRSVRVLAGAQGERIALTDRAAEPALAAILAQFDADASPPTRALRVSEDPPLHLRIAPVPREWVFDPRRPTALVTLHGEARLPRDIDGVLTDLFGLLPSEARLAAALAGGDRLGEAASRLGLTIETARNYSKKIFAKTGTQGQADLVRLILTQGLAEVEYPQAPR